MFKFKTLSLYLFGLYLQGFMYVSAVFVSILILSNTFDVLQKFKNITLPTKFLWRLILYKIPYLLNETTPLICFITMLFFIKRLLKQNELIAILGSGISLRKILIIPILASGLLGILIIVIINPLGTYCLQKYEYLDTKLMSRKHKSFVVGQDGLLVYEEYAHENRIIMAKSVDLTSKVLKDVTILFVDYENNFLKRLDATSAILDKNTFHLNEAKEIIGNDTNNHKSLIIPTNLTVEYFTQSLILPEMISIWNLKTSINKFLNSGLSVTTYQIYYYKQLYKPLLMISVAMFGACFLSLNSRDNSQKKLFAYGLFSGIAVYALIEIVSRILVNSNLEPAFAILLPIFLLLLISNFVVLHLKEA